LLATWDGSPAEQRELILSIAIEKFFAQANAGDVLGHVPADRYDGFLCDLFDKVGVPKMREVVSPKFRKELHEQAEAPSKRKRKSRKANKSDQKRIRKISMQRTADASGRRFTCSARAATVPGTNPGEAVGPFFGRAQGPSTDSPTASSIAKRRRSDAS
jgi:hypothetical protein